jgi:hypothetical protein
MEEDFQLSKPVFVDLKTGWYDRSLGKNNIVFAKDITVCPVQGRYRVNADANKKGISEFWFDAEFKTGKKEVLTKALVNERFSKLKRVVEKLLKFVLLYLPKDKVYVKESGSGFHVYFFLEGCDQKTWEIITRFVLQRVKLPNTKNADRLTFGLDIDSILSSERKISEVGSWNKVKRDFKGEVDYLNFNTYLSVDDFFKLCSYPFCSVLEDVCYPNQYNSSPIPEKLLKEAREADSVGTMEGSSCLALQKPSRVLEFKGIIKKEDVAYQLRKYCDCYWRILRDPHAPWFARNFLVKWLIYSMKLEKAEILELIDKYNAWGDYDPRITAFYVNKHFRDGTNESRVKRPPKKETLKKYGLCVNNFGECVYGKPNKKQYGGEKLWVVAVETRKGVL